MVWVKRGAITTAAFATLVAIFVAVGWLRVDAGAPAREVVLVIRDMSFYVEGQFDTANPPLRFRAGERVRLVLRNEEIGMRHNFAVPAWEVSTTELNGQGKTDLEFEVPRKPGRHEYICTPHSALMRGTIEIQ
jgi:plastocyanin